MKLWPPDTFKLAFSTSVSSERSRFVSVRSRVSSRSARRCRESDLGVSDPAAVTSWFWGAVTSVKRQSHQARRPKLSERASEGAELVLSETPPFRLPVVWGGLGEVIGNCHT